MHDYPIASRGKIAAEAIFIKKTVRLSVRTAVLICVFSVAALAALGGALISRNAELTQRDREMDAVYSRALTTLVTSVGELETSLRKALWSTSPSMTCSTCTDVFGKAMAAQTSLGELPFSDLDLTNTAGFISRVGDWAWALARNAAAGQELSDGDRENLRAMSDAAAALSASLASLSAEAAEKAAAAASLGDGFKTIESEFPEVPSLVYDGPFSSHISRREPLFIKDMPEASEAEAARIAADFLGVETVESAGTSGGELPCYIFTSGQRTVFVTRRGGAVLSMLSSERPYGEVNRAEAELIAERFLASRGFESMKKSYSVSDGLTVVSFAYEEDGVVCYPDLIKVGVAADGSVASFEAAGYIMNHRERGLAEPSVTAGEARSLVPEGLTVLREGLAVIPTEGKNERYCRELVCEDGEGDHVLIYVGAEELRQEKILLLIEDENGVLAL
ncbi:MAG: germination protein YpeB [Oscillospiraceae bacterium]|nr:germination protein YpeB [Oscillospiraceae bacterium]